MVVAHYDGDKLLVDGEVVPRYVYLGDNPKRKVITSVIFPEGLQSIGDDALSGCSLTSVAFPVLELCAARVSGLILKVYKSLFSGKELMD